MTGSRREVEVTGSRVPASRFEVAPKVAGRLETLRVNFMADGKFYSAGGVFR